MLELDTWRVRANLMMIELDLVDTFLRLATTSPSAESRMRNHVYACEALQMASRYRSLLNTPPELTRVIETKFRDAESDLEAARGRL